MEGESDNIRHLREFGTSYMKESLFRPKVAKPEEVHYSKNDLQIGKTLDGRIYTIDLREACRMLFIGATRCMPKGTLVKTKKGLFPIEECKEVVSWNFEKNKEEIKPCIVHNSGKQKVVVIKTSQGEIRCSPNHKWFVRRNGKIMEVETRNLYKSDRFLKVNGT